MQLRSPIFVLAILALTACASAPDRPSAPGPSAPPSLERGAQLVAAQCASCHAIDATTKSPHPLAPALTALTTRLDTDDLAFAMGTHARWSDMPPLRLSSEELADLNAYLRDTQAKHP